MLKTMKEGWLVNNEDGMAVWDDCIWALKYCAAYMFGTTEDMAKVYKMRPDFDPEKVVNIYSNNMAALSERLSRKVSSEFFSDSLIMKAGAGEVQKILSDDSPYLELNMETDYMSFAGYECSPEDFSDMIRLASSKLDWAVLYGSGDDLEPLGLLNAAGVKKHKFAELKEDTHIQVLERFLATNPNAEKPAWIIGSKSWEQMEQSHEEMKQGTLSGIPCFMLDWSRYSNADENRMYDIFLGDWADFRVNLDKVWHLVYDFGNGKHASSMFITWVIMFAAIRVPKKYVAGRKLSKAITQE
jgi:hypothetical protein